jgi:hypothetical protein
MTSRFKVHALRPVDGERGSALILALVLTVVITFLGFGLITRSMLVTRIAGNERYSTKAFYAADTGFAAARARLRIAREAAFSYLVNDMRSAGTQTRGAITVEVGDLSTVGEPQPAMYSQTGGGQGSSTEPLFYYFYKGTSTGRQAFTRSERVVTATMTIGPVPPRLPEEAGSGAVLGGP